MHTLVINSADRVAGNINSFAVKLPNSVPDAASLRLVYFRGPNIMFNVTSNNNKISFNIGTDYTTIITPGAYTIDQLLTEVATTMNAQNNNSFAASCDINTLRTTITGTTAFTVTWSTESSIGSILGYTLNTSGTTHTSDHALNLAQPYFIYLTLNRYSLTGTDTNTNNFHFYIPVSVNTGEFIDYEPKCPQEIIVDGLKSRLEFDITSNGPFNLNTGDWSTVFNVKINER